MNFFLNLSMSNLLITFFIGYVVYKLTKLYLRVWSLPPGPLPIPVLGNILCVNEHWSLVARKLAQRYGSVFTLWVGMEPIVFISDIDLARDTFRRNEMAGRAEDFFSECLSNDRHSDIAFADYGRHWEAMRRLAHSAVQKYSNTEKLVNLVTDCVDQTFAEIIKREGIDTAFNTNNYLFSMFLNIMATSAFGKRYELDDPEYLYLKYIQRDLFIELNPKIVIREFFPFVKLFFLYSDAVNDMIIKFNKHLDNFKVKFRNHYEDYDESVIRDFCDTLITAKNEALKEGKESAPYLTDTNLAMAAFDLLLAGTDTSSATFEWIIILLIRYNDVQKTLRNEVDSIIGDRIPTHEDKSRCHYTMAFISEVLRFRNVIPQGLTHKAVVSCKIGDYNIDKGTKVHVMHGDALNDQKHWQQPQEFKPERFLDNDGKYISSRPKAFIPFGVGRRVCLGEKLAIADLFLVLIRFLQRTTDYDLELEANNADILEPNPNIIVQAVPRPHKIIIKAKSVEM